MKVIIYYDDDSNTDSKTFLTKKSGYSELSSVAAKYKLRAACISEDFIDCIAISKEPKCFITTEVQKT